MKTFKSIFALGIFIVGLSLTSCSSDDKYVEPQNPEHLPEYPGPVHPMEPVKEPV
ncbi:hypothetical protein [Carboxylicivirga sp. M1479]|uniref:hypothetical protein n=1 Tax=Carboxylicivirga sp. M1479 TaxID=2594476 RepID=UPI00163DD16F|nr:hypothetical protein [Carboxylicivirga sp. M1479]